MLLGGFYLDKSELFVDFGDGTQFANHSDHPNSETLYPESNSYRDIVIKATRPIKAGE